MGGITLADNGNKLGHYLDIKKPKGVQFRCSHIYIEVNLEKGLSEALTLTLGYWSHIQELDYEKIPFKCNFFHVYDNFTKSCPKLVESQKTATPPAPKDTDSKWLSIDDDPLEERSLKPHSIRPHLKIRLLS